MEKNKLFVSDWTDVVAEARNEIVFEDKNKDYGAYDLRKNYNKAIVIALAISVSTFLFFISMPVIIAFFTKDEVQDAASLVEVAIDLEAPPPIDESEPPPPPPPPPPVIETIKFVPPEVVDEKVEDEEIPPPQEKITEQVSTVTQEGTGDEEIIIPENTGNGVVETKEEIFTVVEQMPEFPGGVEEMYKFLYKLLVYPPIGREEGISGKVILNFKVDKEGGISDIEVLRGLKGYPAFENEAIRVVKKMPRWKPGKQNGKAVNVSFNLPVSFTIK